MSKWELLVQTDLSPLVLDMSQCTQHLWHYQGQTARWTLKERCAEREMDPTACLRLRPVPPPSPPAPPHPHEHQTRIKKQEGLLESPVQSLSVNAPNVSDIMPRPLKRALKCFLRVCFVANGQHAPSSTNKAEDLQEKDKHQNIKNALWK